ncbi:hypothetical protein ACWDTT_31840, partial [Streptosporangium sandarakinum]
MRRLILGPLGLSGTVAPDASPEIAAPHARAYYRYEEAGERKTIDVTRQNPSWVSTGGDMISTTQDLHTFIGVPEGPAEAPLNGVTIGQAGGVLAGMRKGRAPAGDAG